MANWDLIGGHPAPGTPEGVEAVGAAFTTLAVRVDEVRDDLRQAGSRSGVGAWRGEAADAFREQISALPGELLSISVSYRQGATAMRTYAAALRREQTAAIRAVEQGEIAASEASRAERARNDAKAQIDSLNGRLRQARAQRDRAQAQYDAAPDAEARATLYPGLQSARALVRRLDADLRAATAERDRQERARRSAVERLEDAQGDAERVRDRIRAAAEAAVRALEQAEKEANLPGWLAREWEDAKVWVATYGPVIAESLDLGVTLFSLAAKIIPAGAPIFLTLAAACGTVAIVVNLAAMAATPGGFTTDRILHVAGEAVGVLAAIAGLGALQRAATSASAATKAATAAKAAHAAKAGTVLSRVKDGVEIAEAGAADGWAGVERKVTGLVVSEAAGFASTHALRGTIRGLHKNQATSEWLNEASRMVKKAHTVEITGVDLLPDRATSASGERAIQSMLGFGRIPPGGFLPAHEGAEILESHALPRAGTEAAFGTAGKVLPDAVDALADDGPAAWLLERFGRGTAEPADDDVAITLPMRTSDQNEES